MRKLLHAKLHGLTVTHADLHYEGSISLPLELIEAANMVEFEAIQVWNVTQGTRFETYIIEGDRNSGIVSVNGAAAHLVDVGDTLIAATFTFLDEGKELSSYCPTVVFIKDNKIKELRSEIAGPGMGKQQVAL